MGFFSTFFRALKVVTTGTVVRQLDTPIINGRCILSLRLKRDAEGKHHVVLAGIASGNYQYFPMELSEFSDFASAVAGLEASIAEACPPAAGELPT